MSKARELAELGAVYDSGALSNRNVIINGNFDIWQRGTSETSSTTDKYVADRWLIGHSGATLDITRQSFTNGQTDVPNNPKYFLRVDCTSADNNVGIYQKIEGVETLAGEAVTVSFYAKYHDEAPTSIHVKLDQQFGSGGSGGTTTTLGSGITLTSSWQKFTYTATLPSISGKTIGTDNSDYLYLYIQNPNNETFNIDVAQVQLERGEAATPFEKRSYGDELARCQRYYFRYSSDSSSDGVYAVGNAYVNNKASCAVSLPVGLRAKPSIGFTNQARIRTGAGSSQGVSTLPINGWSNDRQGSIIQLTGTTTTTNLTVGDAAQFRIGLGDYIEFDAEI